MKIITIKDFIRTATEDIDVYNNVTDDGGVAYCPPLFLTEEGEKEFAEVLNYKIEVDEDNKSAEVICDDEEEHTPWQLKKRKAEKLFWAAAGYCSEEDYELWFSLENQEKVKYSFHNVEQLACALLTAPQGTAFDFTLDQSEESFWGGEPTGWYGAKITNLFDEREGALVVGYWGGGDTQIFDIYNERGSLTIKDYVQETLQAFSISNGGNGTTFCVEITAQNKKYFEEEKL